LSIVLLFWENILESKKGGESLLFGGMDSRLRGNDIKRSGNDIKGSGNTKEECPP